MCQYGVALVSRIDKIISLFCKIDLCKRLYSAEETYSFIDPTHCSHPIVTVFICVHSTYVCTYAARRDETEISD